MKQAFDALGKTGATKFVVDLRGTARGDIDDGIATARLFVPRARWRCGRRRTSARW